MIRANHKKWARFIYNIYINSLIKKSFSAFYLANPFPRLPEGKGLLITPNHTSWWDGFFVDYMTRRFHDKLLHVMMLEEQLSRYWFFAKLGAYSIDPGNRESVQETMDYTGEVINKNENIAIMFPQGILKSYRRRPIKLKKAGINMIVSGKEKNFVILPVALKIQFYTERHPEVIAHFGRVLYPEKVQRDFNVFRDEFIHNIDMLDEACCNRKFVIEIVHGNNCH
ncbi:lysophospholipid acyltransferase family protein [Spirochaetota bacterium]